MLQLLLNVFKYHGLPLSKVPVMDPKTYRVDLLEYHGLHWYPKLTALWWVEFCDVFQYIITFNLSP